ncbi:MAG: carboxypeptidase-like regulatory domain-containing protein, partial [Bacteroidota bacterium]
MMNTIKNIIVPFLFLLLFAGCDENVFQPTDLETVGRVRINVSLKGDPVSGAKVCVYNNLLIRNLDGTNCNESILDSVTNSLGFVEFNLPGDSTYFITVVSEVEGVTFNNLNSHPNNVISTENARHEDDLEIVDIELFTISDLAQLDNSTRLRLTVRDEADFPLANATVCLYKNQSFQEANAPGCQGSLVQGTTNADGQVLFSNLDPVRYFVNTSAEVGVLFLDNTQNSSAEVMT